MHYEKFATRYKDAEKDIFLLDRTKEQQGIMSELIRQGIKKFLGQGKAVALIANKKSYASGVICRACGHIPQCSNCSVSIAYHQLPNGMMTGICHICKTQYTTFETCPECHSTDITTYGVGVQQIAEFVEKEYALNPIIIDSQKTNSLSKLKNNDRNGQVFIGTQLLCQPPAGVDFGLCVILDADSGLNVPDHTANEKNFWFIYETLTKYNCKNFIIQTYNPQHQSIRQACKLDVAWFVQSEYNSRIEHGYPPYKDICIIHYKNEVEQKTLTQVNTLYQEILFLREKYGLKDMEIYDTPPLIYKIFGKYRYNIIIKGDQTRNFMDIIYSKLRLNQRWFYVNRTPYSLTE